MTAPKPVEFRGSALDDLRAFPTSARREAGQQLDQVLERWFNALKKVYVPQVSPNSSTKVALFIAAAAQTWDTPDKVKDAQWEMIQCFLTQGPGQIEAQLKFKYPVSRGKWPGQRAQIEAAAQLCKQIAAS